MENQFATVGRLIRIAHSRKRSYSSGTGLGVVPLHIARLANRQGRVDEDLNKPLRTDQLTNFVSGLFIRTDRCADDRSVMTNNLRCDKADSQNIHIPIFPGKSQALGEMSADNIAVE